MKKIICLLLALAIIMPAIPAFAEDFPGFTAQKLYMGSAKSDFRIVIPVERVKDISHELFKNKVIECELVFNNEKTPFKSVIKDVEADETRYVLVVPETADAKVKDIQDAVNKGGRLNIRVLNEKGEVPAAPSVSSDDSSFSAAFSVENPFTGMEGTRFRFVVKANVLPVKNAEAYKNKKIEYTQILNGTKNTFLSIIEKVEVRNNDTEYVFVVPEAETGAAEALKEFQTAGGRFSLKVFPDAGEKPTPETIPFESLPDFGNIFEPYLTKKVPEILETLSETVSDGVVTKEILYSSYDGKNKIFARIFSPEKEGKYPGVVLYHGGSGSADVHKELAKFLAGNGYVAITPELPGIGEPKKLKSEGPFLQMGYSQKAQIGMNTDPKNSSIFQGVISAIDSVYLLKSLPNVESDKTGITGNSWGGYTTTKIAGLLGDDISCAYSVYGCAYYDEGTHWSKNVFPNFGETNEKLWMKYLDASVNIDNLSAPYFIEAPTNDSYYFPTAVAKTLDSIKGEKNKAFTANTDHVVHPNNFTQILGFFDHYLKGAEKNLVSAWDISTSLTENGGINVTFNVPADRKCDAVVYYADATPHWNDKKWKKATATVENGKVTAVIHPHLIFENTVLYGFVTDENNFYASTDMVTLNGLTPVTLSDEELAKFLEDFIWVNETDTDAKQSGKWVVSSLVGYEGQSIYSGAKDATVTYAPLLGNGIYKVSAYVIVHQNNQKNLKATVNHANGTEEKLISTNIPESGWVEIGEFEFKAGREGSVILGAGDGSAGEPNPIRLDAVQFELVEKIEAENPDEIKVILNSKKLSFPEDQMPVIIEGRTMVAFRTIFEALGLSVNWDSETSTALGEKEGMKISLPIGNTVATVNGVQKTTDVPAQLINSRTFVPLRFLSEALGFSVSWDGDTKTVTISGQ